MTRVFRMNSRHEDVLNEVAPQLRVPRGKRVDDPDTEVCSVRVEITMLHSKPPPQRHAEETHDDGVGEARHYARRLREERVTDEGFQMGSCNFDSSVNHDLSV